MSPTKLLVLAVFLQVFLTFGLLALLGRIRSAALKRGEVQLDDIALSPTAWPEKAQQFGNAHNNQYQLPLLLYVAVLLALVTRTVDQTLALAAWVFVMSRLVHAYIHVTSNFVPARFLAFGVGVAALATMWVWLAMRLLTELA